jgi:nucleoporin NUP82
MDDNTDYSDATKRLGRQQLAWMADLDNQEPQPVESTVGDFDVEVYTRPHKPGKVPKLQGPFKIEGQPEEGDNELETLLSDILFIGAKADSDMLMDGEDDELEEADEEGLTLGVVCLLSSSGRITVCLDIDGVEAQWLPRRSVSGKQYHVPEPANQPELLAYQVLDTLRTREIKSMPQDAWPMFTPDTESRYSFYVTNPSNLTYISLSPFVSRLESELQSGDSSGVDFRLDLLAKGENFIRDRLISEPLSKNQSSELSACQIIRDPSLGHLLLSNSNHGPVAVFLEDASDAAGALTYASEVASQVSDEDYHAPLLLCAPRPVYEPPPAFRTPSALPAYLEQLRLGKQQRLLTEQVRLSPATLTIFADAHKILSEETHRIGSAAAELFRRCEQLQLDLREQIAKANDVAERVEQVVGEDHDDGEAYVTTAEAVEARLEAVERRQEMLLERVERLKRKSNRPLSRQLSDKERAWFEEVAHFQESLASVPESYAAAVVQKPGSRPTSSRGGQKDLGKRFREVRELKEEVSKQFEVFMGKVEKKGDGDGEGPRPDENSIPGEIRREKVAQVQVAIEREEALVAAVKGRLERLAIV